MSQFNFCCVPYLQVVQLWAYVDIFTAFKLRGPVLTNRFIICVFLSPKSNSPELVYELELAALSEAESKGKASKAQAHREEASAARSVLPHFNLEGLWVGK